jgi:hypothetical protein
VERLPARMPADENSANRAGNEFPTPTGDEISDYPDYVK